MDQRLVYKLPNPSLVTAALDLNEDVQSLRRARELLSRVDPGNMAEERELGRKMQRMVIAQLKMCERYAENKLRHDYLAPVRRRVN